MINLCLRATRRFLLKRRLICLALMSGLVLLVTFGETGIALASEPTPQALGPGNFRIEVGPSHYYENPPGTPRQVWGYGADRLGSIEPDPFIYSVNGRQYHLKAIHANLHPHERRRSIRLLFRVIAVGDEAAATDAPDRITLTSNGRTITLRRVYSARSISHTIPDYRESFEANYGAASARDTNAARGMFIDHSGATIDVALRPRGDAQPPGRPPDSLTSGFLHSGWPSVRWQYTEDPRPMVTNSQIRFRRHSDDPWERGPVTDVGSASAGRNDFPPSNFGHSDPPPWGTFMVQVRTAYDYNGDVKWSDWSRSHRFEYLPPPPRLTPLQGRLRVEVEPRAGYPSHELQYKTYRQGSYFYNHSGSLDLMGVTTGVIPNLRGGAGYEVQVRYSTGGERSPWSEPVRAAPLRPRQTFRFTAVFTEEGLYNFGADGEWDNRPECEIQRSLPMDERDPSIVCKDDDGYRHAGRTRGEGFGQNQHVWPDSRFGPNRAYDYNFEDYSVTAFQWGNEQDSYSPSILGRNDLIIRGEGHYSIRSTYPFFPLPIPDDNFEVVIDGRSYGRTERLFWSRWNLFEWTSGAGYYRGIRGVAADLRANVPLYTPVTVEFRYGTGS